MVKATKDTPEPPAGRKAADAKIAATGGKSSGGPDDTPRQRVRDKPIEDVDPTLIFMGQTINKLRKKMDWTQSELAAKSGTNGATIFLAESGKHNMTIRVIMQIAKALNVEVGDFYPRTTVQTGARLSEVAEVLTDATARIAIQLRTISRLVAELEDEATSIIPRR